MSDITKAKSSRSSSYLQVTTIVFILWSAAIGAGMVYSLRLGDKPVQLCVRAEETCAADSIGRLGSSCVYLCPQPQSVTEVVAALTDNNSIVRRRAAFALDRVALSDPLDRERIVASLTDALHTPDSIVRLKAAQALKRIGTPEALAAIHNFTVTAAEPRLRGHAPRTPDLL